MQLLRKVPELHATIADMQLIYTMFIRSILEQSAVVWHSSLTAENTSDIERIQYIRGKL